MKTILLIFFVSMTLAGCDDKVPVSEKSGKLANAVVLRVSHLERSGYEGNNPTKIVLLIKGQSLIFYADAEDVPYLPFVEKGDVVNLSYTSADETTARITELEILNLQEKKGVEK